MSTSDAAAASAVAPEPDPLACHDSGQTAPAGPQPPPAKARSAAMVGGEASVFAITAAPKTVRAGESLLFSLALFTNR
eukprot:COSAG04_NODE_2670_length_3757_cov_3.001367_3_plen_78_part_00